MSRVLPTSANAPNTFFEVTPADGALLQGCQYLRIGGAGNLVLKGVQPDAVARTYVVAEGEYFPFGAGYVMAATTATSIEALAAS